MTLGSLHERFRAGHVWPSDPESSRASQGTMSGAFTNYSTVRATLRADTCRWPSLQSNQLIFKYANRKTSRYV